MEGLHTYIIKKHLEQLLSIKYPATSFLVSTSGNFTFRK